MAGFPVSYGPHRYACFFAHRFLSKTGSQAGFFDFIYIIFLLKICVPAGLVTGLRITSRLQVC